MVLAVVLLAEILAVALALARSPEAAFLTELARVSFFVQWVGLTSAALICAARARLTRCSVATVSLAVMVLLTANVCVLSAAGTGLGIWLQNRGYGAGIFPLELWPLLVRNAGIAVIVGALLLRYFFVSHQWRRHVRAEASARIDALQARIRPHFLFNSMNTIASLTRSDPVRAEEAVEDLADLFRATLRDTGTLITLKEELELARIYQRIEMLRLGDRLSVTWDVRELPMRARVPSLTIQPLLENAIYHGIEPLDGGGRVTVSGRRDGQRISISVSNPRPPRGQGRTSAGNRLALDNIRERLELAYADAASVATDESDAEYRVTVRFPVDL
jgi:two-component system sensor histidine kinase AlgZ